MDNRPLAVSYLTATRPATSLVLRADRRGGPRARTDRDHPRRPARRRAVRLRRSGPDARTGVLLMPRLHRHPESMRPWGEHLAAAGFAVARPAAARPRHHAGRTSTWPRWTQWYGGGRARLRRAGRRVRQGLRGRAVDGRHAGAPARRDPPGRLAGLVLVNPALLTQRLDAKLLPLLAPADSRAGRRSPATSRSRASTELAYPELP